MSAIECKIIICLNEASAATKTALDVIDDLKKSENVTNELIETQEKYTHKMKNLLSKLTFDG